MLLAGRSPHRIAEFIPQFKDLVSLFHFSGDQPRLGNHLAASLLQPQLREYGRLGPVLGRLRQALSQAAPGAGQFYGQWLAALKAQWAPTAPIPGTASSALWARKRLQTGLASWATLRHTTILVNDESAAECGEGGFEELATTPPRGYVEPDPATFGAMAQLSMSPPRWSRRHRRWPSLGRRRSAEDLIADSPLEAGRTGTPARARRHRRDPAIAAEAAPPFPRPRRLPRRPSSLSRASECTSSSPGRPRSPSPSPTLYQDRRRRRKACPSLLVHKQWDRPSRWDQIVPYFGPREIVEGSVCPFHSPRRSTHRPTWARLAQQQPPSSIAPYLVPDRCQCPAPSPL